ncbi:pyridoxamine 5'-phosphate oxidase family protein [Caulobacter sp. UC70_42]|uniref:2Fe-2S iron-sulfur cluster-binding protein n=1 Tax=Caulobacter sp. UC70_42 TaxID=3374551 RepID=UPI0037572B36
MTTTEKPSPWHRGEVEIQRSVGVEARMDGIGRRVIRDYLLDQHRAFFPQLPFLVVGSVDPAGAPWATIVAGQPGFIGSPDIYTLSIEAARQPSDPADAGMEDGDPVGLLGVELHTRRRNRMNGALRRTAGGFDVVVDQSYGNCPQYIQLRDFAIVGDPAAPYAGEVETSTDLDVDARALIAAADTFFVASYSDEGGRRVDVSHRGGKPGFVRIGQDGVLTIPDFAGNLFFNTLGNIRLNGKAGLVFVDFSSGDMLQLTGEAEVVLDSPEIAAFQGAERLWRVRPTKIVRRRSILPVRWADRANGASPNALITGDWDATAARLKAAELAGRWRPFRVRKITRESATIRSFELEPADGVATIPHLAGQHLPIRVLLPGDERPVIRTYTLSVAPSDPFYRISVKREGGVSQYLHDQIREGDLIEARAPAGGFTIDAAERRPAVLLAAGVGITPMIAMARHILFEGFRTRGVRRTYIFQAARTKAERAFDEELAALVEAGQGAIRLTRILGDTDGADPDDYDLLGRLDMDALRAELPFDDYDFYLCGPPGFMQAIYDGLRGLNVADRRIHAEAFGPASLQRTPDLGGAPAKVGPPPATTSKPVLFMESSKEARWEPGSGTLLELAEARGLQPEFSCRAGTCGSCKTKVLQGAVSYLTPPTAPVAEDEALICCAVPAAEGEALQLAL